MSGDDRPVVRVPGDLVVEDRIAGQLTFRQLGYLAVAGGGTTLALLGSGPAARIVGVLLALAGIAGAAVRPSGRPLDAWLLPALRYWRRSRATCSADLPVEPEVASPPEPAVVVAVPVAVGVSAETPTERPIRSASRPVSRLVAGFGAVLVGALAVVGVVRLVPAARPAPQQQQPIWVVPVTPPSEEEVHDAVEAYVEWLLRND